MDKIVIDLAKRLGLKLIMLRDIGFAGIIIVTADHRSTKLEYFINFDIRVSRI